MVRQAELLGLNRTSLYYQPRPVSEKELQLKHRIDEIHTEWPYYGSRKITRQLVREGQDTCRETVRQYMAEMGLQVIYPKPNLSRRHPDHPIYPYLLRHITASYPNHIWGIDITYIRLRHDWLYLVAILDWYSRYVVAWQLSDTLEIPFVLTAVDQALAQAQPAIWNSDQGSHFTSPQYTQHLLDRDVKISMDGRGRAFDNIFVERLWRSVKYEEVYPNAYETPCQARQGLTHYFHHYNQVRIHQSLHYRTPAEVYLVEATSHPIDATSAMNVKE
ncbi:MAG: IS3 family transposase [Chloroflexi bacterium]|nr:IS3 family transposase [Chloroflexota bacterium]